MQAVLLSDHPHVLAGLQATLADLGSELTVQRATRLTRPTAGGTRRSPSRPPAAADLVFVDLDWCGLHSLSDVTQRVREWLTDTRVVVLLDRPEQVSQVHRAQVDADLLVAKSAAPAVVCRSVRRFLASPASRSAQRRRRQGHGARRATGCRPSAVRDGAQVGG